MALHSYWRDCQEWTKAGLPLSTTSNEACKLYDATITQYVGWYDDQSVGGIEASVAKMLETDPNFVMGHVLSNGLDVMGTALSTTLHPDFAKNIEKMVKLADTRSVNDREKLHAQAIKLCADGYMSEACNVWEDILVQHPTDMLALKFAHDAYFYLGYQPEMRDSIARVIPHWKTDMPLYSYLMGMHSFGLVETNFYEQAEKVAAKGLELNQRDAWSTHSMAHALEMMGRQNDGIAFLSSTVQDWSVCGMLSCHNFWHWAIYHIEKGEYQAALDIFDSECSSAFTKSGAMLDMVDVCSMLFRLEMEGVDVKDRWNELFELCRPHIDDHITVFNDCHILMFCLGAKQKETTKKMMDSIEEYIRNGNGTNHDITKEVGHTILEAFTAYDEGDFSKAVDLLAPVRYKVLKIGGSNAQRDLFNLFLINAAIKSSTKQHRKLARSLLVERKANKENAPMTDRLIARAMALHTD